MRRLLVGVDHEAKGLLAMNSKKSTKSEPKVTRVIHPSQEAPRLKCLGGSQSDTWNDILANQTLQTLWLKHSDEGERDKQVRATAAALIGIAPQDELEGMMAAQLLAAHNAAMECYRRAMLGEQTFEGRRENLSQANKLSRSFAVLLEALNRHRGKGQQKVTVEHVTVNAGGQAIVGSVQSPGGGVSSQPEEQPHALTHAPGNPMRSPHAERELVPCASDA
jgi:hypothetical protein